MTNKNQPCSICGEVKFNYRQYGEYYCNNPAHSPIRRKKPYPVTETNAERLERLERLKNINDIKHVVALNHPSDNSYKPESIDLEYDIDRLIQQAELVPTLREQESILNYEGKRLVDENRRLHEAIQVAVSYFRQDEHREGMRELEKALEGTR